MTSIVANAAFKTVYAGAYLFIDNVEVFKDLVADFIRKDQPLHLLRCWDLINGEVEALVA